MAFLDDPRITHGLIIRFKPKSFLPTIHRTLTVAPRDGSLRPVTLERRGRSKYYVGSVALRRLEAAMRFKVRRELGRQLESLSTGRDPVPLSTVAQRWLRFHGCDPNVDPDENMRRLRRLRRLDRDSAPGRPSILSRHAFHASGVVTTKSATIDSVSPYDRRRIDGSRNGSSTLPPPYSAGPASSMQRLPACLVISMPNHVAGSAVSLRAPTFGAARQGCQELPTSPAHRCLVSTMVSPSFRTIYAPYRASPTDPGLPSLSNTAGPPYGEYHLPQVTPTSAAHFEQMSLAHGASPIYHELPASLPEPPRQVVTERRSGAQLSELPGSEPPTNDVVAKGAGTSGGSWREKAIDTVERTRSTDIGTGSRALRDGERTRDCRR